MSYSMIRFLLFCLFLPSSFQEFYFIYSNIQISPPRRQETVRRSYTPEQDYSDRRANNYREQDSPKQPYYEVNQISVFG